MDMCFPDIEVRYLRFYDSKAAFYTPRLSRAGDDRHECPLSPQLQDTLTQRFAQRQARAGKGNVYLSGTQAHVPVPMLQRDRDGWAG